MDTDFDIAIVGAGAAGLAAGIFAAQTRPHLRIGLCDGARSIGAKILVSGGGRCNVTNERVTASDFHAPHRTVERILRRFDEHATVRWFQSMGVRLKPEPTGKLFPVSNTARTVLEAIVRRCHELGVTLMTQHRIKEIAPTPKGFQIFHESGHVNARHVIMATGGQSLPKSGSDGHGWSMVRQLGHTITPTNPALVPLVLDDSFFHHVLSGISHEAAVTTRVGGRMVDRRVGNLLWTHFGVSGPVVLDASRFWTIANGACEKVSVSLSFFPDKTFEEVDHWLSDGTRLPGNKKVLTLLSQTIPNRTAKALCTYVGGELAPPPDEAISGIGFLDFGNRALNKVPRQQRRALAQALTDLRLPIVRTRGWNFAEVTAGGVPLEEVNPRSMTSRKVPGLYLIGEMLDCDGRIGGFNFQWAWTTGHIAGCCAAQSLDPGPN